MFIYCYKYSYFVTIQTYLYFIIGVCAAMSVFIFVLFANRPGWMPGHDNNFFGWTFGVAIASFFALLGSGAFYLVETNTQLKKIKYLKESQTKFDIEFTK